MKLSKYIHMGESQGTLLTLWKSLINSNLLSSAGDTDFFITCISYLGLATGQFMEVQIILSVFVLRIIEYDMLEKLLFY